MSQTEPNPQHRSTCTARVRVTSETGIVRILLHATDTASWVPSTARGPRPHSSAHPRCGGLACCRGHPQPSMPQTPELGAGNTSPCLSLRSMTEKNMPKPRQLPKGRKSEEPLTGMCTRNMSFFWLELFLLLLLEASFFLSMAVLPMPSPKRAAERWIWKGRLLFHLSPPSHGQQLLQAPYFLFSFLSLFFFSPPS